MMNIQCTRLGWAAAALIGMAIPVVLPAVARAQEARADLSGTWILNEEQSDNPREMMRGGHGGEGRMGGFGGHSGPMGGRRGMEGMREAMGSVMRPATQLRLTVEDEQVTIESLEGESLVLPTTGEPIETTVGDHDVEMAAKWEDGSLVVERRIEGGIRITRTYAREPESPQMIVTVDVEGPRTMTFKRVYDEAEG